MVVSMMNTKKYVYAFEDGDGKNKIMLGGKGAGLCEMTQIGLNVPPGFTITTEACVAFLETNHLPDGLMDDIKVHMAALCPSCNTRRMVETAAHLSDHVLPPLPLRQWVLAVPKQLRYFLHDDAALQGVVVRILLRAIERCLREHSPGSSAAARLGAVVFIHRFGSALNTHFHFHCCIIDGVFAAGYAVDAAAGVVFHAASGLAAAAVTTVQAQVRQRVLRAFIRHGLLDQRAGNQMGGWAHGGGFALDASVRSAGADRAGRERLLRYCARPPFALEHLHQHDAELDIAQRSGMGPHRPHCTGCRIRSTYHLVRRNFCRALGTLGWSAQPVGNFGSGLDQAWPLRAGERRSADFFEEWKVNIGIDRG